MSNYIVNTNGAAIQISDRGQREPALFLLHYWRGSFRSWQGVMDRLSDRALRRARPARLGGSVVADGRYDLAAMADDAEAIIGAFGIIYDPS
jgi:pimeloyl-ACP methyl ester carboxylesterase